jgi:hypothetical protein
MTSASPAQNDTHQHKKYSEMSHLPTLAKSVCLARGKTGCVKRILAQSHSFILEKDTINKQNTHSIWFGFQASSEHEPAW